MIAVIIPTYKNKALLITNLKHNLKFIAKYEIIIVNDDPSESLKYDLRPFFEKNLNLTLVENERNLGFAGAVNIAVLKTVNPYLMLLNSDVRLKDDSFKKALKFIKKDKSIFAVAFAQEEKTGEVVGKNIVYWRRGMFFHMSADNLSSGVNGWAEGGAALISKQKFVDLGGYDDLYSPFYWEDIDLSYRAWKTGNKIIFAPSVKVIHHHESTIGKYFSSNYTKSVSFRNQFMFIWKNITDRKLIFSHLIFLAFNLINIGLVKRDFSLIRGFFLALGKIFTILKVRKNCAKLNKLNDTEVLELFNS